MLLSKPTLIVTALAFVMLASGRASALSQDVGGITCDVIVDYGATSPAYYETFLAFLEGYLAGEKNSAKIGPDARDTGALMSEIIEYCKVSRDATLTAAVAAVTK